MQTPLRYLEELPRGSRLIVRDHVWYREWDGAWHCECDGSDIDWTWDEVLEDCGPLTYKYEVEIPQ